MFFKKYFIHWSKYLVIGSLSAAFLLGGAAALNHKASALTSSTFSGILKDQDGNLIRNVDITLRGTQNNRVEDRTDTNGGFSISVNPGMYSLEIENDSSLNYNGLPKFLIAQPQINPSVDLTTSITQDLTLPIATVNYTLYNAQWYGTSNATLSTNVSAANTPSVSLYPGAAPASPLSGQSGGTRTPDGFGKRSYKYIAGSVLAPGSISATWKSGAPGYPGGKSNEYTLTTIAGTNSIDVPNTPPANNSFTGYLKDSTGAAYSGVTVQLTDAYNNMVSANTTSTGYFNVAARPGQYSLKMTRSSASNTQVAVNLSQVDSTRFIDLTSGNFYQDLTLPVGTVSYTAYDALGSIAAYEDIRANTNNTPPLQLYPGGPYFNSATASGGSWRTDYLGKGTLKAYVGSTFTGTGLSSGICTKNKSPNTCNRLLVTVAAGSQSGVVIGSRTTTPNGLSVTSPTALPALTWQPVQSAAKYSIYRSGVKIGTSTDTAFTDNNVGNGIYQYQVTATDANGIESFLSTTVQVTVVQTTPSIDRLNFSKNPVIRGTTTTVTANVTGNLYGISDGEYYVDGVDPGQGNGVSMSYDNGVLFADIHNLEVGMHTINMRAHNSMGWSPVLTGTLEVVRPTFSGILKDQDGNLIRNVDIVLRDTQNNHAESRTATDGSFSITIDPGVYALELENDSALNYNGLPKFSIAQPTNNPSIDLTSSSVTQDLTLPIATVNFTLYNAQWYGTSNATLTTHVSIENTPSVSLYPGAILAMPTQPQHNGTRTPDGFGKGSYKYIAGSILTPGSISAIWKSGAPGYPGGESNEYTLTTVAGVNNIDIPNTPPTNNVFTGYLKDSTGLGYGGVKITLTDSYGNRASSDTVSPEGSFSVPARPGSYTLKLDQYNNDYLGTIHLEQTSQAPSINLLSDNFNQDLTLPVGIVNYTAYNSVGGAVMYEDIQARTSSLPSMQLYTNSAYFNSTSGAGMRSGTNHLGQGSFKAYIGATFAGTGVSDGICTLEQTPTICNTSPITVGTNPVTVNLTNPLSP